MTRESRGVCHTGISQLRSGLCEGTRNLGGWASDYFLLLMLSARFHTFCVCVASDEHLTDTNPHPQCVSAPIEAVLWNFSECMHATFQKSLHAWLAMPQVKQPRKLTRESQAHCFPFSLSEMERCWLNRVFHFLNRTLCLARPDRT